MLFHTFTSPLMQDTAEYKGVELTLMSRKQLSYCLVDVAKESGSLRLTSMAFEKDGSFFIKFSERLWGETLFECTRDKCEGALNLIRADLERNEFSENEIHQLKETFSASYIDPLNVVGTFVSYVEDCCLKFREYPGEFFAPYTVVVQSSGSGKSRLLREVSKVRSTLYVCCRTGKSGFPLRSSLAIKSLFGALEEIKPQEACLDELVRRLRRAELAARHYLPRAVEFSDYDPSKADFASEQLSERIWNAEEFEEGNISSTDEVVLLVIDEARWLLDEKASGSPSGVNMFRFFRRAIKRYWSKY